MRKSILSILIAVIGFNLTGCDMYNSDNKDVSSNKAKLIKISSLPLIEETILSLSPKFGGKRNDIIMRQVCALAKMDETQEQFNQFFIDKGIELDKLADKDPGFNLLANGDLEQKKVACMAYIISSAFTLPALDGIYDKSEGVSEPVLVENISLANELSERLQVMNANGIFFSIISQKLEGKNYDDISQYKNMVIKLANELSSVYFEIISDNQIGTQHYTLNKVNSGVLDFSSNDGYVYSLKNNLVTLKLENINWYGEGELLGKKYFISIRKS